MEPCFVPQLLPFWNNNLVVVENVRRTVLLAPMDGRPLTTIADGSDDECCFGIIVNAVISSVPKHSNIVTRNKETAIIITILLSYFK